MILLSMRFIFWRANRIEEAKALMTRWNRVIQFEVEDMVPFHVKVQEGHASIFRGETENPDLLIKGNTKNFRKIMRGELRFEEAFLRKKFEASGSIRDAAIFNRIIGIVLDSYKWPVLFFQQLFGRFI